MWGREGPFCSWASFEKCRQALWGLEGRCEDSGHLYLFLGATVFLGMVLQLVPH